VQVSGGCFVVGASLRDDLRVPAVRAFYATTPAGPSQAVVHRNEESLARASRVCRGRCSDATLLAYGMVFALAVGEPAPV
jgi:hypothetical protein